MKITQEKLAHPVKLEWISVIRIKGTNFEKQNILKYFNHMYKMKSQCTEKLILLHIFWHFSSVVLSIKCIPKDFKGKNGWLAIAHGQH